MSVAEEWDEVTSSQVVEHAKLVTSDTEDTDCPLVKIVHNHYEVTVVDDKGEGRKESVQIQTTNTGGVERLKLGPSRPKDGIEGWVTILAHLSCYQANDSRLIDVIKNEYLHPPSDLDYSGRFVPSRNRQSQYQQDEFLDKIIFQGKVKNGFFVEAGADDFLDGSNTLLLEEKHNWSGLLVEPFVFRFHLGLLANRKSWSSPVCLSTSQKPEIVNCSVNTMEGGMFGIVPPDMAEELVQDGESLVRLQCLPLYSLLLALENPTVNLLSLDIEGAEFEVFKSIPWEEVDIEVIVTELLHAGQVYPGSRLEMIEYLESKNYQYIGNLFDDIFVRKDLLGEKYKIDYEEAEKIFPLFSRNLNLDRNHLMDKFTVIWGKGKNSDPLNGACDLKDDLLSVINEYTISQIFTI